MTTLPKPVQTFAIVTDRTRRAGIRVARVFVLEDLEPVFAAARCEERGFSRLDHYLPVTRLARERRGIARKLGNLVEGQAVSECLAELNRAIDALEAARISAGQASDAVRTPTRNEFGELLPRRLPYAD